MNILKSMNNTLSFNFHIVKDIVFKNIVIIKIDIDFD